MARSTDRLSLAFALFVSVVAALGLYGSSSWIGRTFPGFLLLENRTVASVGLSLWPATADGTIFQKRLMAIGGLEVSTAAQVHDAVAKLPPGTSVEYRFQRGDSELVRHIETRAFGGADFALIFGLYLLNGLVLGAAALVALRARHRTPAALAAVPLLSVGSVWALSAMDLYGPYHLFRLHAFSEAMLLPATLHMALCFPRPAVWMRKRRLWVVAPYAVGLGIALPYQLLISTHEGYVTTHLLAISAFGAALVALVVSEVERYRRPASPEVRERLQVVALGAILALSLPAAVMLLELVTGGRTPQNAAALTAFLFPMAIGYAVIRDARLVPAAPAR